MSRLLKIPYILRRVSKLIIIAIIALLVPIYQSSALAEPGSKTSESEPVSLNETSEIKSMKHVSIPELTAKAAILIDEETGLVLYEKNADAQLYPASITKTLTALIALENSNLDHEMKASKNAVYDIGKNGMNVGIKPGEIFTMDAILRAMLIRSANECSNIIAENIAGSVGSFMDLANTRARELGATNTHFVNPSGSHDKEHVTSARDMSLIAREAMKNPIFREIVGLSYYELPSSNLNDMIVPMSTTNKLIRRSSGIYNKHFIGIKTGYTSQAGHNFIGAAQKDGRVLLSVLMGVDNFTLENGVFIQTEALMNYGFNNFSKQKVIESNKLVASRKVVDSENDESVDIYISKDISVLLPNDKESWNNDWKVEQNQVMDFSIVAPVNKGDVVGYVEFIIRDTIIGKVDLIVDRNVERKQVKKTIGVVQVLTSSKLLVYSLLIVGGLAALVVILRLVLPPLQRRTRRLRRARRKW